MAFDLDDSHIIVLFELLSCNVDASIGLSSRVLQIGLQCLVFSCDHLVQLELQLTDVLLSAEVVLLCVVIHVVGLNQKVLGGLEVVLNVEILDESWVQVVIYDFSSPKHLFKVLAI